VIHNIEGDFMTINFLFKLLMSDKPSRNLVVFEKELFELIPELEVCKGFDQKIEWHIYDVYQHILCVVDNVPNDLVSRVAALFHDVGKPLSFTEDENGVGHFYGHWEESQKIFDEFARKYNLDKDFAKQVSNLILYHDKRVKNMSDEEMRELYQIFGNEGLKRLFDFKRADLLAQNKKFHGGLRDIDNQEKKMLLKYN